MSKELTDERFADGRRLALRACDHCGVPWQEPRTNILKVSKVFPCFMSSSGKPRCRDVRYRKRLSYMMYVRHRK